jgi:ATP-dependent Clp protease ATP-binding subunit ClpA
MVGTKYIGEWETRLADLVARTRAPRRVVLYFTNINDVPTAGTTSSNKQNFLSLLAPYIRRGELVVAGEATPAELARGLDRTAKGLFQIVKVPEVEPGELGAIVDEVIAARGRAAGVEIVVPAEVRELVSDLAATYHAGLAEPGRSLRVLAEALEPRLEQPAPRT